MAQLEILVGMIASGKSTYSRKRAAEGAIIINDDAFVTALHGGIYTAYDDALRPGYKFVQSSAARFFLALGKDVIIDSTNLSDRTRQKWVQLAREHHVSCVAVVFEKRPAWLHAERRAAHDARGVSVQQWTKIAEIHAEEWQDVSSDEGFDGVVVFS